MVKVNNKDIKTILVSLLCVSIVNFEHVIAGWEEQNKTTDKCIRFFLMRESTLNKKSN